MPTLFNPTHRPPGCKVVHFTVDGTIDLMSVTPLTLVELGDSATAAAPEDPNVPWLWECSEKTEEGAGWKKIQRWTPALGDALSYSCDLMVRVARTSIEAIHLPDRAASTLQ